MNDPGIFVAVSSTSAKLCSLDRDGKPAYQWQEAGQQPQGSVNWLRNGKAFLTTQGGNVAAHVVDNLKEKPPVILSLPSGPLMGRVSGDGKCLVLVQSSVPGSINVYDLQSLLASASGAPAKPAVVLQDHDKPILAIAASFSTTHIASSNSLGAVYLHEAGSGSRSTLGALPGGPMLMTPKRCLGFSQVNKPLRLAAGADDGQVLVWQISPMASGPIVMPNKLRGRVMGVGFAVYKKSLLSLQPSSVLLACSESGQLIITDLRSFPNVQSQASISVELSVAVSCMAVRDDGQFVAVGTKDGRVGLIRVEDLISHGQNVTKLGCIRVFDLGTHLDVVDIAFQRIRESRESREHNNRESRENAQPAPAAVPVVPSASASEPAQPQSQPASEQAAPADAVDGSGSGSQRQGTSSERQDAHAQGTRTAPASTSSSSSSGAAAAAPPPGSFGAGALQRQQLGSATGNAAAGSGAATATRPAAAAPGPPPAQPAGLHRRPSDVGGGGGTSTSTTPSGLPPGGTEEAPAGAEGQMQPSPAARVLAAGGAAVSSSSPVSSPRPRSPRPTMSGGGHPPARPYGASSGGDQLSATNLRAYLDDFRQEVRDLVRGLQADMVRQAVSAEMAHRNDIAVLQQENRALWEEVLAERGADGSGKALTVERMAYQYLASQPVQTLKPRQLQEFFEMLQVQLPVGES
ncbi:hypothetical protein VOLCADRAFT_103510 [Volvox carteri f. nagariensis]|uniref:Uncharacterized protein n=1 Tax=Volvox carteri f. nagariensis TaxID=3068 RepID=D8TMC8_VOLCA|nr:uncharacterized protein VOLCADRAFT_103510 [Volvox carteri f. nagariensis]EFJ51480.1 hypothetical protein VOLCADRAFT_103510 [Volvox carteri f. nagariensis]|eukprot:XP_002947432.1 hypothetical protein VOLCADRAFT_103510 [Volvox carteri f. nagariensis]